MDDLKNPLATLPASLKLTDNEILDSGNPVASYIPDQNRIDWHWRRLDISEDLIRFATNEAELWNGVIANEDTAQPYRLRAKHTVQGWLARYPDLQLALDRLGVQFELNNACVLDIGGTGKDSPYWLQSGPARIDQVEVSPHSQAVCYWKMRGASQQTENSNTTFIFHTIPAEHLPFQEAQFDVVFSRATLHHCQRPEVFEQIFRVLKPGGLLIFCERFLADWSYQAMRVARWVRRADRGTDNPLRNSEMGVLNRMFEITGGKCTSVFHGNLFEREKKHMLREANPLAAAKLTFAGIKGLSPGDST